MRLVFSVALFLTMQLSAAHIANHITIQTITGSGTFNNSTNIIKDDVIPGEGSVWSASDKVWWEDSEESFVLDLGAIFMIADLLASVDNNDIYKFEYSTNNFTYFPLVTIDDDHGEVGGGMDTLSSDSGHAEYVAALDFASVQARYVRVSAVQGFPGEGDNRNSIGEVQLFGTSAVPEPSTIALMGAGLGLLALRRRK